MSGKSKLQQTQTGFKVSARDGDLRPVIKAPSIATDDQHDVVQYGV